MKIRAMCSCEKCRGKIHVFRAKRKRINGIPVVEGNAPCGMRTRWVRGLVVYPRDIASEIALFEAGSETSDPSAHAKLEGEWRN